MGIRDLNKILKKECPSVFKTVPMSQFKGKRVAIDGYNIAYKYLSVAHSRIVSATDVSMTDVNRGTVTNTWLGMVLDFVVKMTKHNITPVFVFDGNAPVEKTDTKNKRIQTRVDRRKKITDLRDKISNSDVLDNNSELITAVRKLAKYDIKMGRDDMNAFKVILRRCGIPVFTSTGEGEKLCASLVISGWCDAVMSKDTDSLTFGAYKVITGISKEKGDFFDVIDLQEVLEGLNMSYESFVDLCILCKCDYNTNIGGIGSVKALKIIKDCKRLENCKELPQNWEDILKYDDCLRIFSPTELYDMIDGYTSYNIDTKIISSAETRDIFNDMKLIHYIPKLKDTLVKVSNGDIDDSEIKSKCREIFDDFINEEADEECEAFDEGMIYTIESSNENIE
jgi:5'-3' exonuclease